MPLEQKQEVQGALLKRVGEGVGGDAEVHTPLLRAHPQHHSVKQQPAGAFVLVACGAGAPQHMTPLSL